MKSIPFAAAVFLLSIALLPRQATAQNDPFAPDPGAPVSAGTQTAPALPRFNVDFVEIPVGEACRFIAETVEQAGGAPLNIVVSKDAAEIALPTMSLRQITFEQFVSFVNRIGGGGYVDDDPFDGDSSGGEFPTPTGQQRYGIVDNDGIWYFWAEKPVAPVAAPGLVSADDGGDDFDRGRAQRVQEPELMTKVFAIDGEVEPTLGLIEEALAESRRQAQWTEPALKFHEPSATLIVTATLPDLQMIDEVIGLMEKRYEELRKQQEGSKAAAHEAELQRMMQELDRQARIADEEKTRLAQDRARQVAQLEAELAEMKKRYTDLHPQVLQLEAELAKALEAQKAAK